MDWITERNARESLDILGQLSNKCAELGGPLSRQLNELVVAKDYARLVNYEINYLEFTGNLRDLTMARQILGFFQKFSDLPLGIDTRKAAIQRFYEAERQCLNTNDRFRRLQSCVSQDVNTVLHLMTRKIASIVGDYWTVDYDYCFGPGANTNVKSALACPRAKLGAALTCSSDMTPAVGDFLEEVPSWAAHHACQENDSSWTVPVVVAPGKVVFVPKNAKTDRSIVIEPLLNSFFQKGIGSYLRHRLSLFGVDLTDQTRNQRLAQLGSLHGNLATVDLSMASDCLSKGLVWEVVPYDFTEMLSHLRTSRVTINGKFNEFEVDIQLEKFSSMGNGYTFELESMIFYALAHSVCTQLKLDCSVVSVYGDDIIVPTEAQQLLTETLEFCGFSLNKEKSFFTGPFRESCGADYYKGFDIRPYYQKTLISDRNLYTMHNWFFRHGEFELAGLVESFTQPHLRLYGPDGFGDGHLLGSYSLRHNRNTKRRGWEGGYFDTYHLRAKRFSKPLPGDAILPVYSVYTRSGEADPTDPDVVRGSRGYAKISIYTLVRGVFLT